MSSFVIGLDYGTNSCRSVLMRIGATEELFSSVFAYPSGEQGVLLDPKDPHLARQHPQDYIDGMVHNIQNVLSEAEKNISNFKAEQVKSIGFATTGSTIMPVNDKAVPLALTDEFKDNLNAYTWLWKDHTSTQEAADITRLAAEHRPEYLDSCGGTYSSEWFWSKIWHLKNSDDKVFKAAYGFIELCDFLPALLSGLTNPKEAICGVCAAGHKALYSEKWGGLPDKEFLTLCDPALAELRDRLYDKAYASNQSAGTVNAEWAKKTGLSEGTTVAVGAFDAHLGAVGAGVKEGSLVKIMGTSTCDLMISKQDQNIKGVCGTVMDSVIPGYVGIEAGQSAVGDIFLWLVNHLVPDSYGTSQDEKFAKLNEEAAKLKPGQSGLLALDWNNGNRSVLVDMDLSGLMIGQTLYSKAHEIYRTLIEATAFGAYKIIQRLDESGASVKEIICCGGLAQKNPMMMQIYADVTGCDIRIAGTQQTCAVGAAISAASAVSDLDMLELQAQMSLVSDQIYKPEPKAVAVYKELFALYNELHDSFGVEGNSCDHFALMKKLNAIRKEANSNVSPEGENHA